jgi:hypothetical protein
LKVAGYADHRSRASGRATPVNALSHCLALRPELARESPVHDDDAFSALSVAFAEGPPGDDRDAKCLEET